MMGDGGLPGGPEYSIRQVIVSGRVINTFQYRSILFSPGDAVKMTESSQTT